MGKKDKKSIEKRQQKAQEKKQTKRKRKEAGSPSSSDFELLSQPSFSEIEPPEGFRPISFVQAMMEYSKPLFDLASAGNNEELNEILQISMLLWNCHIMKTTGNGECPRAHVLRLLRTVLGVDENEAEELFDQMMKRKSWLFPDEIQPKGARIMFMRKEVSHLVAEFNYRKLPSADAHVPPDEEDIGCVEKIQKMDRYRIDGTEYDEWEDHYFSMEATCKERYGKWLRDKGLDEYAEEFTFYIETFLNFIFRYEHWETVLLRTASGVVFEEFFADHLLRKVVMEPQRYVECVPAIRLFYKFLAEKGYLVDPTPFISILDRIEPNFLQSLRKHFG